MEPREPIEIKILHETSEEPKHDIEIKVLETPLSEVEPISRPRSLHVEKKADLAEIIEWPLLKACEIFFDKRIATYESTANREHIRYKYPVAASLSIVGDKLSEANKAIAKSMASGEILTPGYTVSIEDPTRYEPMHKMMVSFDIPMEEGITAEEIERRSIDFANHFEPNDLISIEVP